MYKLINIIKSNRGMIMKLICVLPLCHRPPACHRCHISPRPAGCMPRGFTHCADLVMCVYSVRRYFKYYSFYAQFFQRYRGVCFTHFICEYSVRFTVVLMKICFSPISLTLFLPQLLPSRHGRALFPSLSIPSFLGL